MGGNDPEDRLNEPGWRDYLEDKPPQYDGVDRLVLGLTTEDRADRGKQREKRRARDVWHRVLAAYLVRTNGATLDSMTGQFGWFNLRLSRRETVDLIDSAKARPKASYFPRDRLHGVRAPDAGGGCPLDRHRRQSTGIWRAVGCVRHSTIGSYRAAVIPWGLLSRDSRGARRQSSRARAVVDPLRQARFHGALRFREDGRYSKIIPILRAVAGTGG
jgi:hypothetical protein